MQRIVKKNAKNIRITYRDLHFNKQNEPEQQVRLL
jgi:hypothetical protein